MVLHAQNLKDISAPLTPESTTRLRTDGAITVPSSDFFGRGLTGSGTVRESVTDKYLEWLRLASKHHSTSGRMNPMNDDTDDLFKHYKAADYRTPLERTADSVSQKLMECVLPQREYRSFPLAKRIGLVACDGVFATAVTSGVGALSSKGIPYLGKLAVKAVTNTVTYRTSRQSSDSFIRYMEVHKFLTQYSGYKGLCAYRLMAIDQMFDNTDAFYANMPRYGSFFFVRNGHIYYVTFKLDYNDRSEDRRYPDVTIMTTKSNLHGLAQIDAYINEKTEESTPKVVKRTEKLIEVQTYDSDGDRSSGANIPGRTWSSIAYTDKLYRELFEDIMAWSTEREAYYAEGIPYKRIYILEGPAGTGKTTIAKILATEIDRTLHIARLTEMNDKQMASFFGRFKGHRGGNKPIILLEDFDSDPILLNRSIGGSRSETLTSRRETKAGIAETQNTRTLSGFLNAIDGVIPLDNVIVIMTTNTTKDLDPAVIREGRVDRIVHVGALDHKAITRYVEARYPGIDTTRIDIDAVVSRGTLGSQLQEVFLKNRVDPEGFIHDLNDFAHNYKTHAERFGITA